MEEERILTIAWASNSTTTAGKRNCKYKVSPSLKAHNSALALPVIPIFLAKPEIQSLAQLRISPPLLANLGKLRTDPSVFSLD